MNKHRILVLLLGVFLVGLIGCSSSEGNNESDGSSGENSYLLSSASTGGTFYPIGSAMSKIINDNEDSLDITNQASAGGDENVNLLNNGDTDFALLAGDIAEQAYEGEGDYNGEPQDLTAVLSMYSEPLSIVTLEEENINSFDDLKGKKVAVGAPGSGSRLKTNQVFKALGVEEEDMDTQDVSFDDGVDGLKDGSTDVVMGWAGVPLPAVLDLSSTHDINLISFTDEEVEKITDEYSWFNEVTIPGETYDGVDQDTLGVANKTQMVVRDDVDEDDVYKVAETLYDNLDELHTAHNSAKEITEDTIAEETIPLHPGAKKFFEEEGIIE